MYIPTNKTHLCEIKPAAPHCRPVAKHERKHAAVKAVGLAGDVVRIHLLPAAGVPADLELVLFLLCVGWLGFV